MMKIIEQAIKRTKLYKDSIERVRYANMRIAELEHENKILADRVYEISQKMVRVSVQRHNDRAFPIMRVVCDIDTSMIEQGLMWGNDSHVINMMARDIGYRAAQQIKQCNFQRWER